MKWLILCLLCLLVVLPIPAQTVTTQIQSFNTVVHMNPGAVPTSSKCLVGFYSTCVVVIPRTSSSSDPYVCAADFTATGQTITVQDGQATPVTWINNVLGSSGSASTWIWSATTDANCRIFPNGVFVVASGSGATGHVIIKYNQ